MSGGGIFSRKKKVEKPDEEGMTMEELQQELDTSIAVNEALTETMSELVAVFGEAAEAEDFDIVEAVTDLNSRATAAEEELAAINELVADNKGKTTLERVENIVPVGKTTSKKQGNEATESNSGKKKTYSSYAHNQKHIEELAKIGVVRKEQTN